MQQRDSNEAGASAKAAAGTETADADADAAAIMDEEWHQEIPLEEIADLVERLLLGGDTGVSTPTPEASDSCNGSDESVGAPQTVLVIGCGTSALPALLLERLPNVRLVLLDSSRTCVEHVRERHRRKCHRRAVVCVCGNVLKPRSTWRLVGGPDDADTSAAPSTLPATFDLILDKGLMDVLLCGDDWDATVPKLLAMLGNNNNDDDSALFSSATATATATTSAPPPLPCSYVLVSYTLPPSTRQFLLDETRGTWDWSFDVATTTNVAGNDEAATAGAEAGGGGAGGGSGSSGRRRRRSMVSLGRRRRVGGSSPWV